MPCSGLTGADGQLAFRAGHPVTLKNGMDVHKPPPALPSDADPRHTYGAAPDYRSPEQIRIAGRVPLVVPQCCSHMLLIHAPAGGIRAR